PLVLYGLRRYFVSGRTWPLAGAAAAWLLQNLSCGYYLLFFSPVVVLYIVWELTARKLWTNRLVVARVAIACAAVAAATVPFLVPYLELRRLGFNPRSLAETKKFSADVYAFLTADPNLWLWGPVATSWQEAEGVLFPGLTIVVLAAIGVALGDAPARTASRELGRRALRSASMLFITLCWLAVVGLLLGWSIRLPGLRVTELWRTVIVAARASGNAGVVGVASGHLHGDDDFRRDHGARPGDSREGADDRGDEPLRLLLSVRARLRRRPRAGTLRDDRHARAVDAGGVRRREARTVWPTRPGRAGLPLHRRRGGRSSHSDQRELDKVRAERARAAAGAR